MMQRENLQRGRLAGLLLVLFSLLLVPCQKLWGQSLETRDEGIQVGRMVLHPSLTLGLSKDDNVFYLSDDLPSENRVESSVMVISPRIVAELPFGQNNLRLGYSPRYHDYSTGDFEQSEKVSHYLDLEGELHIGSALEITLRNHAVWGTVELPEIDAGRENTFGLVPFRLQEPEAEIRLNLGGRSAISLIPRYASVKFDDEEGASFFDYDRNELEFRYNYGLSEATEIYTYFNRSDTDQERDQVFFGDIDVRERSIGLGLSRTLNRRVLTRFSAGYNSQEYDGSTGRDFSGATFDAAAIYNLNDATRLQLTLGRRAFQSYFINNNYYVNSSVGLRLTQQIGRRTFWRVGAIFQKNSYPDPVDISTTGSGDTDEPGTPGYGFIDIYESYLPSHEQGVRRRDSSLRAQVGLGYQFDRKLRILIEYTPEWRDSNIEQDLGNGPIDPFRYQIDRLQLTIQVGWL